MANDYEEAFDSEKNQAHNYFMKLLHRRASRGCPARVPRLLALLLSAWFAWPAAATNHQLRQDEIMAAKGG